MEKFLEIKQNELPLENLKGSCGYAAILRKVGVIGDSLSSGEFEAHDKDSNITYNDMYDYSWPAFLSRMTGGEYLNFSRGGMTAKEFYESWADKNNFWIPCQAYIIALGTNDLFTFNGPVGSANNIDINNISKNEDTYIANITKIILKLRQVEKDCRIFLVSTQKENNTYHDEKVRLARDELSKLCNLFDRIYLIDIFEYGPTYDLKTSKAKLGGHPNCMGYYYGALLIGNYIDYLIRKHYQDFITVPFIGTNLKNNNCK